MKKISILLTVFCLFAAVLSAAADSVWIPMDDYFMDAWKPDSDNSCKSQDRVFYLAAGEKGYVTAVKTPLDLTPVKTYPNGTEFKITFVCGKGENLWGAIEAVRMPGETVFTEDWQGTSGYIAFRDLVQSYDTEAFKEDHSKELVSFGKDDYDLCSGGEFVLWQTPNSGVQIEYVFKDYITYMCIDYAGDTITDNKLFSFGAFYEDPNGNRWVEVTLRREWEHGWFCLDAMTEGGVKPVY